MTKTCLVSIGPTTTATVTTLLGVNIKGNGFLIDYFDFGSG